MAKVRGHAPPGDSPLTDGREEALPGAAAAAVVVAPVLLLLQPDGGAAGAGGGAAGAGGGAGAQLLGGGEFRGHLLPSQPPHADSATPGTATEGAEEAGDAAE